MKKAEYVGTTNRPKYAECIGKDQCFVVEVSDPESGKYVIRAFENRNDSLEKLIRSNFRSMVYLDFWAPFSIDHAKLTDLLSSKPFRITEVELTKARDRDLVKVAFEYDAPDFKGIRFRKGWVLLDPSESWAVQEYYQENDALKMGAKIIGWRVRKLVSYASSRNGMPVLKQVRRLAGKKEVESDVTELLKFEHLIVPEAEFTLAAFGLKGVDRPPSLTAYVDRTHWWFVGGGLAAICFAVLLRYLMCRQPH